MSDYYRFSLNFQIRRDTPAALRSALSALADRRLPDKADLAALPPLIADYLSHPHPPEGGVDGDGFTYRYARNGIPHREEKPDDPTHYIHIERTFHDDEFATGGMYFVFWLFQFAAEDGHLATKLLFFDTPPEIYTRQGDDILITRLSYNPQEFRPLFLRQTPLDPVDPIVVTETSRQNLKDLLDNIAFMAER